MFESHGTLALEKLHPGILEQADVRDCARRADRDGAVVQFLDDRVVDLAVNHFIEVACMMRRWSPCEAKDVEAGLPHEIVPLRQNC